MGETFSVVIHGPTPLLCLCNFRQNVLTEVIFIILVRGIDKTQKYIPDITDRFYFLSKIILLTSSVSQKKLSELDNSSNFTSTWTF